MNMSKERKSPLGDRSYSIDILSVPSLISVSIIAGCVNYLMGDGSITFANVFWSFAHLAAWAAWGWLVLSKREAGHPARILYSVWFLLPLISAAALLVMSFIPASAEFLSTAPGNILATVFIVGCLPVSGFGFFGSAGYAANDIVMIALSALMLFVPLIAAARRARRLMRRKK